MSFGRKVRRRAARDYKQMIEKGESVKNAEGRLVHVLGSAHVERLAQMRAMLVPPPPAGSEDSDRDDIDPVDYRQELNRRKRLRRSRRAA